MSDTTPEGLRRATVRWASEDEFERELAAINRRPVFDGSGPRRSLLEHSEGGESLLDRHTTTGFTTPPLPSTIGQGHYDRPPKTRAA